MQVPPAILLSSLNTDAVCELVKQTEGINTTMLPQYTTTIKEVCMSMTLNVFDTNRHDRVIVISIEQNKTSLYFAG